MKLIEKLSTQHLGTSYETQVRFGLHFLTDEQIKKIQNMTFAIYKDILAVCEQHNLTIMMSGGTALGTIRHHGFIPWDDDMDLMMPREDYKKFIEIFLSTLGNKYLINIESTLPGLFIRIDQPGTKLIGVSHNPKYPDEGVGIDIFPIDFVPNNQIAYYLKGVAISILRFIIISRRMYMRRNRIAWQYYGQSPFLRILYCLRICIGFLSCLFPYKLLCRYFDLFISSSSKSKRVTIASGRKQYFGETLPSEVFLPVRQMDFEGHTAYVPNDYNKYLTNLYGDYMKIPPENKREHHAITKFSINNE